MRREPEGVLLRIDAASGLVAGPARAGVGGWSRWRPADSMALVVVLLLVAWMGQARAAGAAKPPESLAGASVAGAPETGHAGGFRQFVDAQVRPRIEGDHVYAFVQDLLVATGAVLVLVCILGVRLRMRQVQARDAHLALTTELESMRSRQTTEVKEMKDQVRTKGMRQSTLFIRMMDMLKAATKEEFFKTLGEALVLGFSVRECAFFLVDSQNQELVPRHYGYVSHRDGEGKTSRNVEETRSASVERMRTRPGDATLVGWCAANRKAVRRDQIEADVTLKHLEWQRPIKTTVACPVMAKDPVTDQDRFVGVIALGETDEGPWTASDSTLLNAVATLTGVAFAKCDLLEFKAAELASSQEISEREREQRKQVRSILDRIVAPQLAEKLLSSPEDVHMQGETVEATLFFSDVRGFTTYAESRSPEQVVEILNEYLSAMTDVILEYGGTLDKFVGDAIVAFWGALPRRDDHAVQAVRAAFKMRTVLAQLHEKWKRENKEPLSVGMGISTGPVLFGCIGSARKLDFTCMGDTVNVGARLEALTRKYPYDLIISKNTFDKVADIVDADCLGEVEVKGKQKMVSIYGVKLVDLGELAHQEAQGGAAS